MCHETLTVKEVFYVLAVESELFAEDVVLLLKVGNLAPYPLYHLNSLPYELLSLLVFSLDLVVQLLLNLFELGSVVNEFGNKREDFGGVTECLIKSLSLINHKQRAFFIDFIIPFEDTARFDAGHLPDELPDCELAVPEQVDQDGLIFPPDRVRLQDGLQVKYLALTQHPNVSFPLFKRG